METLDIINKNLDLESIKREYNKNKFVIIRDFLEEEGAERLLKYYQGMPPEWWSWMFLPDPDLGLENWRTSVYKDDGSPALEQIIQRKRDFINSMYAENRGFTYIYRRVFFGSHFPDCLCEECVFRKQFLETSPMLEFLQGLTDHQILKPGELFASRYSKGDYNGPHSDVNKGKVTIVLNLSKDWLPQDGGIFFGMEEDYVTIKYAEVPTFNSLVIFDVSEGGMPHLVNHVTVNDKERFAVTGWYE